MVSQHGECSIWMIHRPRPRSCASLGLLGTGDPRVLMRTGEFRYLHPGLADADAGALIDAMTRYLEFIERPVVIWTRPGGHRAAAGTAPSVA